MNPIDIAVAAIAFIIVVGSISLAYKRKKQKKHGCCSSGGCAGCSHCPSIDNKNA